MKKKSILYRAFVVVMAVITIASVCLIGVSFFIPPEEPEDSRANLTEEEYAQKLADENPLVLEAFSYIASQKSQQKFALRFGRIGSYKKITQMCIGRQKFNYLKVEYSVLDDSELRTLTYYGGSNTGSVTVGSGLYDEALRNARIGQNVSDAFADGEIDEDKQNVQYERYLDGEDLEILYKYWKGEYNNDGTDSVQ